MDQITVKELQHTETHREAKNNHFKESPGKFFIIYTIYLYICMYVHVHR